MRAAGAQRPLGASPFLPPDHWSYAVLRRFDAAGLLPPGSDLARQGIPQAEIDSLLAFAAGEDSAGIGAQYLRKYRQELTARSSNIPHFNVSTLAAYHVTEDQLLAGVGVDTFWVAGEETEDERGASALLRSSLASPYFGGAIAVSNRRVSELQAVLASSTVGLWAGRRQLGFGTAHSGGIVTDDARLDAIGVFLARPLSLPVVKHIRFEMHVSQIDNVLNFGGVERATEPWYWTGRGSFELHPRFRVAVTRGMMFGGEGNLEVTAARVFKNLIGVYTSDDENSFANQMFSVDLRYRPPTGSLPVALYLDWGSDDAAGGWWDVPAIIGGAEISLLPTRDFGFGVERVEFLRNVTNNSHWYQNSWFRGSWADEGRALGHPLGGHGVEWRVFANGGLPARGISFDAAAFTRNRRRQNIFAPPRQGSSVGAVFNTDARLNSSLRLVINAELEHGEGNDNWTAVDARAGLRFTF